MEKFAETMRCPSDEAFARLAEASLSPDEQAALRAHLETCARCRQVAAGMCALPTEPTIGAKASEDSLAPGTVIDGKYRLERVIGMGGMGRVFAAMHIELEQRVAIKVMHHEASDESDSAKRFMREGRNAALLRSDHAVRILDVGKLPSGTPFLVMEYLDGEDLGSLQLKRELSVPEVVEYISQAMVAISEAHDAGLVHRDIKPQNLFLERLPDGRARIKVLDFGIAKRLSLQHGKASTLTGDNMLLGSPHFMSPEQVHAPAQVDRRADIWALGACMFKLFTGKPPYVSATVQGVVARILTEPPPHAREVDPNIPAALDDVLVRCMERDLNKRFQSVSELSVALHDAMKPPATNATTQRIPVLPSAKLAVTQALPAVASAKTTLPLTTLVLPARAPKAPAPPSGEARTTPAGARTWQRSASTAFFVLTVALFVVWLSAGRPVLIDPSPTPEPAASEVVVSPSSAASPPSAASALSATPAPNDLRLSTHTVRAAPRSMVITTDPADALVSVGNGLQQPTPLMVELGANESVEIHAQREGYVSQTVTVNGSELDGPFKAITLERKGQKPAPLPSRAQRASPLAQPAAPEPALPVNINANPVFCSPDERDPVTGRCPSAKKRRSPPDDR